MSERVLLHVGTPKTGTSYLQDVLFRNRVKLITQGITYPAERFDAHFLAALDLMKMPWGGLQAEAIGAWDELADAVRKAPGTSIISHEILATASRSQVKRALDVAGLRHRDRGPRDPLGARPGPADPGGVAGERQAPGRPLATGTSSRGSRTRSGAAGSAAGSGASRRSRTSSTAGATTCRPEHVHLVTVPPPGAPDLLWKRFSTAFGLDGLDLDLEAERVNPSLGVPEIALIRRINRRAPTRSCTRPTTGRWSASCSRTRRCRSARTSPRLALPPDVHPWVQELSQSWVEEIRAAGTTSSAS